MVIGLIKKKQTNNIFESRDPSFKEFLRELYVIGRLKYLSMPYKNRPSIADAWPILYGIDMVVLDIF